MFTVAQTNDPAFYGVYQVLIIGQFEQLNIDKTTTPVSETIEFTFTVSPCTVTQFDVVSPAIDTVIYTLDEASITFGQYEFQ